MTEREEDETTADIRHQRVRAGVTAVISQKELFVVY